MTKGQLYARGFKVLMLALCASSSAFGANILWQGDSGSSFTSGSNWQGGVAPGLGDTAIFDNVSAFRSTTPSVGSNTSVLGITFNNGADAYTFGGTSTLTIGTGGIVNNDGSVQTFNGPLALSGTQAWNASAGNLDFNSGATINNAGFGLTMTAGTSRTISVSGNISGAGGLTKNGAGTVLLDSATGNGFTGTTKIDAGTLQAGNTGVLGSTSAIQVNNGGTLLLSGTSTNRISNTAPITLGGGQIEINGNNLSETMGALTLTANSSLDYVGTGSTLNFVSLTSSTPTTLSIYNWSSGSDHLILGSAPSNVTVTFYSGTETAPGTGFSGIYDPGTGQMTAVPEPSTILAGLGLVGFLGWRERRRISTLFKSQRNEELFATA